MDLIKQNFLELIALLIQVNFMCSQNLVEEKFIEHELKTDLNLDVLPKGYLEVLFPSGIKAELGNELTPTQVKDLPIMKWEYEEGALYTALMTGPDEFARGDPKYKEVKHWLTVNIPGNNVTEGDTLFELIPAVPEKNTGLHRYVLLIFKQNERIIVDDISTIPSCTVYMRLNTSTRQLMTEYGLSDPLFGNFYLAQYDDMVPELAKVFKNECGDD